MWAAAASGIEKGRPLSPLSFPRYLKGVLVRRLSKKYKRKTRDKNTQMHLDPEERPAIKKSNTKKVQAVCLMSDKKNLKGL